LDGTEELTVEDRRIAAATADRPLVAAINKCDARRVLAPSAIEPLMNGTPHRVVEVSALTGEGVDGVRAGLADVLGIGVSHSGVTDAVSNRRHVEALTRSRQALGRAAEISAAGAPGEIVAMELREALGAIGEVTGRTLGEDLLDRIFSRFCVGK
jgi:tRNA modification GTPase